ncbi:UCH-domain-containing protein [Microthyrium microscopicum]|uniref:ubiquitinyl hydrolase 1 n=1 Tax=Microthyrium microscopicum TaxID=703497 RepID=A0A6A6UP83_9PEZI|nr:UCH-domain-containing protein [Microthyrium microscopicum]
MDPQSAIFTPRDDIWRMQSDMSRIQQTQQEHSDRLNRLERRQDDDARTKSIWGASSPFPSVLAGTPQQRPIEQPPADAFSGFDDTPANLIGSLHLDADDEPRRVGATSRANSVRFDETANQGHWSHPNRSSLDLLPRSGSSLGSHPMMERTYSTKSDGRQSSTGHSVTSRANSLGIDTLNGLGVSDLPPLNPGLFILGTCPSIIRCWLTTKFKHDTLLYAAVCTGSFESLVSLSLISKLGLSNQIRIEDAKQKVKLAVYLPEAVVRSASSRSSSPAPQLPTLTIDFTIVPDENIDCDKTIRIAIGSDILRAHNADILFSSSTMTIYDDDQSKLSIPLVRPEDEGTFKSLRTYGLPLPSQASSVGTENDEASHQSEAIEPSIKSNDAKDFLATPSPSILPTLLHAKEESRISLDSSSSRPSLGRLDTSRETSAPQDSPNTSSSRPSTSAQAIWNNWRREPEKSTNSSESSWGKSSTGYQRRETGIKVLRPLKSSSRTFSGTQPAPSPNATQSRFFEEGRRRPSGEGLDSSKKPSLVAMGKETTRTTKSANPRKLVQPNNDSVLAPYNAPDTPNTDGPASPPSSSPRAADSPIHRASASPGPPYRHLPPHIQPEVSSPFEAGSPSEAFAGVTLNSDAVSEMGIDRPENDSHGAPVDTTSPLKQQQDSGGSSPQHTHTSRSSSPTKRRASEMDEDETQVPADDSMDVDRPKAAGVLNTTAHESSSGPGSRTTPSSSRIDETSSATTDEDNNDPLPSLDDQVTMVYQQLMQETEKTEGRPGYLISRQWLGRVISRSKFNSEMGPFDKNCQEGEIGPVDNSSIIDTGSIDTNLRDEAGKPFVPLKTGLRISSDFEILSEESWKHVLKWYNIAENQSPIIRYQHSTTPDTDVEPEWMFEVYPPIFTLRKLVSDKANLGPEKLTPAPRVLTSRSQKYMEFLKVVKRQLGISVSTKIKLARVVDLEAASDNTGAINGAGILTPDASRDNSPARATVTATKFIESAQYKIFQENDQIDLLEQKDQSMDENYNGRVNLGTLGLNVDQTLIICEESAKHSLPKKTGAKAALAKDTDSVASSGRNSPARMMTRGRFQRQGRPKGTVGLVNLGNTCYMNSALQCMRACQELSTFFISNTWVHELNKDNPIGHKGQLAQSYAGLLHEIYDKTLTSMAPRSFKSTVGRFAPMFSGYGQQDSQEFMSFLVDGLHEDLNRVLKKPYRENPDSDDATVHDPEAIRELGEVFRDNHRARNSSIITDLFNGFYKNKLVCPSCEKISITFDPFSLLTLQLPMEHYWEYTFEFHPLHDKPILMRVDNSKGPTIKDLKEFVVYRVMEDRAAIVEQNLLANDDMVIYELEDTPTNYPQKKPRSMLDVDKKEEPEVPADEVRQLVTVYNRQHGRSYNNSRNVTLMPMFITLSKDEMADHREIYRKILRVVANLTSRNLMDIVANHSASSDNETSASPDQEESLEEKSSADNIKTQSLASDSYVDVSMEDAEESAKAVDTESEDSSSPESIYQYPFLEPGAPIPDILLKLFDIAVGHTGDVIPTSSGNFSSTSVDLTKQYPSLSSRIPKPVDPLTPEDSSASPAPTEASDDTTSDEPATNTTEAQMSYDDNENSSELSFKPGSNRNARGKGKKNKRKDKKYGKGNNRTQNPRKDNKTSRFVSEEPETFAEGDASLIRPNEFLFVDWNPDAYEELFIPATKYESRKRSSLFEDKELERKREQREARRKRGIQLDDCFAETSKEEILTEENAWYCSNCKERRQASKKLEIWTIPDVLVIHLKRFSLAGRSMRDKIDVLVDFPVEGLDLTGRVGVDEGKPLLYDLFAVDNHYGGMGGGHYTAYAKNFVDDEWYEYNDASVHKIQPHSTVTKAAYLLFYRRRQDDPLGPPNVQKMVHQYFNADDSDNTSDSNRSDRSGNGARPAGGTFYRNGSSGALKDPAAARPPLLGGASSDGGLGEDSGTEMENLSGMAMIPFNNSMGLTSMEDLNNPPGYDDEGVDMSETTLFSNMHGGRITNPVQQPSWSFDQLEADADGDGDVDSNAAAASDDDFDDATGGKKFEDFGDDEHDDQYGHQSSFQVNSGYGPEPEHKSQLSRYTYDPLENQHRSSPADDEDVPELSTFMDMDTVQKSVETEEHEVKHDTEMK